MKMIGHVEKAMSRVIDMIAWKRLEFVNQSSSDIRVIAHAN